MKYKYVVPVVALAIIGASTFGIVKVSAQDASTNTGDTLVKKIADHFNLKQSDVQQVFDQNKTDHDAQMSKNNQSRLDRLVKDGKITAAQEQLILNKQKELKAQRDADKDKVSNMTQADRQAYMKTQRDALAQWAKDNGIDLKYLGGGMGPKGGHGPGQDRPMDKPTS